MNFNFNFYSTIYHEWVWNTRTHAWFHNTLNQTTLIRHLLGNAHGNASFYKCCKQRLIQLDSRLLPLRLSRSLKNIKVLWIGQFEYHVIPGWKSPTSALTITLNLQDQIIVANYNNITYSTKKLQYKLKYKDICPLNY